jgi:bacterioferritin-associated ferredoxin
LKDFNGTTEPVHSKAGFGSDCQTCHTEAAWKPSSFNHNTATNFALNGGHKAVSCNQCHSQGFAGTSTTCVACHLGDYNATTNPAHAAAQFPTDCKMCHNEADWKEATFDHNTTTQFPLKGGHLGLTCNQCHTQGFAGTSTACVSCHLKDFNGTTEPVHSKAGFGSDCQTCHTEAAWKPSSFNHNTATSFALNGGHKAVSCNQCHSQGFAGTSTNCVACHLGDYNATTNPAHAAAQFPTDCKMCHNEADWKEATFDHNTTTQFPLKGGHLGLTCNQCHTQGFAGTSTACVSCHLKDFNGTTEPVHSKAGFGSDCQTCHTEAAWKPSSFNHNTATSFALTGVHRTVSCNQCHTIGFKGTSTTCVACHLSDYNATTNPAHATAKFPTNCETCHSTTTWSSSTFNHDSQHFPIYSGNHRGEWTTCTQCHTNPSNFGVFSCINCHEHNKSSTDSDHRGVSGYVYNSANCLSCHPRGNS